MRVLAVREPWASLIMSGDKELEIRSQPTKIQERIVIYASRTKMKQQELEWLVERNQVKIPDTHQGNVLGTVDLISCTKKNLKYEDLDQHLTNPSWFKKETYGWLMHEPIKCVPFEWKMPKGTVVWAPIDYNDMLLCTMVYTNGIDIVKFDTSKAKPAIDDEVCACRDGRVTSLTPGRIGVVGTRVNDDMASRKLKLDEILIRLS